MHDTIVSILNQRCRNAITGISTELSIKEDHYRLLHTPGMGRGDLGSISSLFYAQLLHS